MDGWVSLLMGCNLLFNMFHQHSGPAVSLQQRSSFGTTVRYIIVASMRSFSAHRFRCNQGMSFDSMAGQVSWEGLGHAIFGSTCLQNRQADASIWRMGVRKHVACAAKRMVSYEGGCASSSVGWMGEYPGYGCWTWRRRMDKWLRVRACV